MNIRTHHNQKLAASFLVLLIGAATASGQPTNIEWNVESGNYSEDLNWNPDFVPDGAFEEQASINNRGLAFVIDTPPNPFALLIGRTASGQVEIRSAGNMSVLETAGMANNGGQTEIGQNNGTGQLTILPGGSFTTSTLASGGADDSALTVGGSGAGTASLTVERSANLRRNTNIIGPNVAFNTDVLSLASSHQLNLDITTAGIAPINVAGNATLRGGLNVNFDGFTPTVGSTWDIVDANSIAGDFSSLGSSQALTDAGLGLVVSQLDGGANGRISRLGLEAQLVLSVDRGTGEVAIENRATGNDVEIDGYGILSPDNAMNPASWSSLESQGESGWLEGGAAPNHIAETALMESKVFAGDSSVSLGDLYSFVPDELGMPYPELGFEYHLASGEVRVGRVDMIGPQNDVVLVVDPDTGETAIQNQSSFDLVIDAYGILSPSNSLNPNGWASFQDAGVSDWAEANPAANHLGETNLFSTLALDGKGQPFSLGNPFNASSPDAMQDLMFEYRLDTGEIRSGAVYYGDPVEFVDEDVCGDFDRDGDVDVADRTIQTINWTGAGNVPDPPKTFEQGDCDADGDVDVADQTGTIQNWTGAQNAGNVVDGGDADLIYDPATGNVTLDASDTASGEFISFVLGTDQDDMRPENAAFPFINTGTNTDAEVFQIGQTDALNLGAGPKIELGEVLPPGIASVEALEEYLTIAEYASDLGAGGTLDLRLVPEPSSLALALFGLLGLAPRCRRKQPTDES